MNATLDRFLYQEKLPDSYAHMAQRYFEPVVEALAEQVSKLKQPLMVGINGCQGSGKTTLSHYLEYRLTSAGYRVLSLSLDDFYLSKSARVALSNDVHPLLKTRGVPGTHNVELLKSTLDGLKTGQKGLPIPRFNKAEDDCMPESEWQTTESRQDIVILEGWCWGARHVEAEMLGEAVNDLEAERDKEGIWRRFVNDQLKQYETLYPYMKFWLMLKAPNFDCVFRWRLEQEHKLAASVGSTSSAGGIMSDSEVKTFVQHYQRITEQVLDSLPEEADLVWELDDQRQIHGITARRELAYLSEIWERTMR